MEKLWPTLCASQGRVGCMQDAASSIGKVLPGLFEEKPEWLRLASACKALTILTAQPLFPLIIPPKDQTACGPISYIGKQERAFACARWVRIARRRTRTSRSARTEP